MSVVVPPDVAPVAGTPEPRQESAESKQLREVSRHFESLLVNQMVSVMRQSVPRSGLVPESHAEKVYQSMLDTEYAKQIAESGELGLGDMIHRQLLRDAAGG